MERRNAILEQLGRELPVLVSRKDVPKFLGGMISSCYLANLDCVGEGPPRVRLGRRVGYTREGLLAWLESRIRVVDSSGEDSGEEFET